MAPLRIQTQRREPGRCRRQRSLELLDLGAGERSTDVQAQGVDGQLGWYADGGREQ